MQKLNVISDCRCVNYKLYKTISMCSSVRHKCTCRSANGTKILSSPTVDSIRTVNTLSRLLSNGKHVLVPGNTGTGKSICYIPAWKSSGAGTASMPNTF